MQNTIIFAVIATLVALAVPSAFETYRSSLPAGQVERIDAPPSVVEAKAETPNKPVPLLDGRLAVLTADPDGHFRTQARINGSLVSVLVDTGATVVAMDEDTAWRLGISTGTADFTVPIQTANGQAMAARATLRRLAIGPVEVENVDALVTRKGTLSTTLLGMSFLSRLKRYEAAGNELKLYR